MSQIDTTFRIKWIFFTTIYPHTRFSLSLSLFLLDHFQKESNTAWRLEKRKRGEKMVFSNRSLWRRARQLRDLIHGHVLLEGMHSCMLHITWLTVYNFARASCVSRMCTRAKTLGADRLNTRERKIHDRGRAWEEWLE